MQAATTTPMRALLSICWTSLHIHRAYPRVAASRPGTCGPMPQAILDVDSVRRTVCVEGFRTVRKMYILRAKMPYRSQYRRTAQPCCCCCCVLQEKRAGFNALLEKHASRCLQQARGSCTQHTAADDPHLSSPTTDDPYPGSQGKVSAVCAFFLLST